MKTKQQNSKLTESEIRSLAKTILREANEKTNKWIKDTKASKEYIDRKNYIIKSEEYITLRDSIKNMKRICKSKKLDFAPSSDTPVLMELYLDSILEKEFKIDKVKMYSIESHWLFGCSDSNDLQKLIDEITVSQIDMDITSLKERLLKKLTKYIK